MWQLIVKGGWIMLPIFLCSIFAFAIMLERLFFYSSIRFDTTTLLSQIMESIRKNKIAEAIETCEKNQFYITNILKVGLLHCEDSKETIKESMENASLYEIPKLEKNLHFLSTIAHSAPLLGLLGTATGLTQCFYTLEKKTLSSGLVNPSDLSAGIWAALITTVAGLCVAIPTYIAYNYFVHTVNLSILEAERAAGELLELLSQKKYRSEI